MTVLALDLGGTKLAAGLVSARGRVSKQLTEAVDTRDVIEQIVRFATPYRAEAIGIAVPGLVRKNGTVWAPNLPGWDAVPLARILAKRMKVPVTVESDRNCVALGEAWRGEARGKSDVIVLIVGTGIGAGIISGGRIVRGAHELSGCAGWMVVTDEKGSLEDLVAGPALARHNDFRKAGRLLGLAVANLISLFDPEVVVLTGGVTNAADRFLPELQRVARERAQPLSAPDVEIVVSKLQSDANLIGAARRTMIELQP